MSFKRPPFPSSEQTDALVSELRTVVASADYAKLLHASRRLAEHAADVSDTDDQEALCLGLATLADVSPVAALAAMESLVRIRHPLADDMLVDLLERSNPLVRRHAAWRLGDRQPSFRAVPGLVELVAAGGIDTMHAHRTLRTWAAAAGHPAAPSIVRAVLARFVTTAEPAGRARLIDLLGVLGGDADEVLVHVAVDEHEHDTVRSAAVGALGERGVPDVDDLLYELATFDDALATDAALALSCRLARTPLPREGSTRERSPSGGLRIAQLVLANGLDGQLNLGGKGDTGGVASLLVSLGEALSTRDDVAHVLTIGRGSVTDAVTGPLSSSRIPLSYAMVAFGDDARPAAAANDSWEHLPSIERGIRRAIRLAGPPDILHLRMADVGTLAGAAVAGEFDIPVCFSVAPDPHNVVHSLQSRGELDEASFMQLDAETHVWFRARLIEQVSATAERLAMFPRRNQAEVLDLLGMDARMMCAQKPEQRIAVVAEGIDISLLDRAAQASESACPVRNSRRPGVLQELSDRLPQGRHGLPLVLSVGRLNPVKGMDRVVSAWASDDRLWRRCNLVIVGGELDRPSATERGVLDSIDRIVPVGDARRDGLVLLGGRPREEVATLLVAAAAGRDGGWPSSGIYVDGALKEEFGLSVLEALAAGLAVVAPSTGGPSTYVDHGDTGILVDPAADLAVAMHEAFGLVHRVGRAARARAMVDERYSVAKMAAALVDLYQPAMAVR
jgi:glycosyltransferase involved in cell wall biosynthesis